MTDQQMAWLLEELHAQRIVLEQILAQLKQIWIDLPTED